MSLEDLKQIDWQHAKIDSIPTYILIGFALVLLGLVLVVLGIFI